MRVEFYKGGDGRLARWRLLAEGERLVLEWPVRPLPGVAGQGTARRASRRRDPHPRRRPA